MVLVLQRELSNTDLPVVCVRMHGMKQPQQDMDHRPRRCQPGLDVLSCSMMEVFEVTDNRYQRQGGFHEHALIPGPSGTELAGLWHPVNPAKAPLSQDDGLALVALH